MTGDGLDTGTAAPVVSASPAATAAFSSRMRVYYEDTDAGGIVYYANWLRFMERARSDWLRALGVAHRALAERDGLVFVVRDVAIEYLRPARLDDLLDVDVRLVELRRASIRVAQSARLVDAAGSSVAAGPLVTATVRIAIVDRASGRPAGLPADLHTTLQGAQAAHDDASASAASLVSPASPAKKAPAQE